MLTELLIEINFCETRAEANAEEKKRSHRRCIRALMRNAVHS